MTAIEIMTGRIIIEPALCINCSDSPCIEACPNQILKLQDSDVVPAQPVEKIKKGLCIECLACELICHLQGEQGMTIELPLPLVEDGES
jgi:ferredoxin-like protein FixX